MTNVTARLTNADEEHLDILLKLADWSAERDDAEWSFVHVPSRAVGDCFRTRFAAGLRGKTVNVVTPSTPKELRMFLPTVYEQAARSDIDVLWLDCVRDGVQVEAHTPTLDDERRFQGLCDWSAAWGSFVMRTNEHRDDIRREFPNTHVVVSCHKDWKRMTRELAPDLWSWKGMALDVTGAATVEMDVRPRQQQNVALDGR